MGEYDNILNHMPAQASKFSDADAAAALYVHVPFCLRRCRYCDFYSTLIDATTAEAFVEALTSELRLRRGQLATPLESIFIGGGTPTSLPPHLLARVITTCRELAGQDTEFTVEANPGTVDGAAAEMLAHDGVNRVSVGVQSFDQRELTLLGRVHGPEQARQAVAELRRAGITNISLDLIYGIPNQTLQGWRQTLEQALELQPQHLSCYALSFEGGTALTADLDAGRVDEMDESLQRECYYRTIDLLTLAGFEHYEISNFARPGRQCRHNLFYWQNSPYVGLGPAAASFIGGVRSVNNADISNYIYRLRHDQLPEASSEKLTGRHALAETLMLWLRLIQGVDRSAFRARFGVDVVEAFPATVARYQTHGALIVTDDRVRLAPNALFVANTILADLLAEA